MHAEELVSSVVRIKLDRWRSLIYDYEAVAAIQHVTGREMLESSTWGDIIKEITEKLNVKLLQQVIWAGLLSDDPELTFERAKALIKGKSLVLLQTKFLKALTIATVETQKQMEEEEPLDPQKDNPEA